MTVIKILCSIALILTALPMGMILPAGRKSLMRAYVYGLIIMWAVTFVFALPMILLDRSLTELTAVTGAVCLITAAAGVAAYIRDKKKRPFSGERTSLKASEIVFLGLFAGLVLFQLYKTVFFAYADGDDAYYVATAQAAAVSDRLYRSDPYTGMPFMQAKRYFLAPFPLWLSMIARVTGLNAAAVSHVAVPLALIPATYGIYSEISKHVFKDNREARYIFLCFIAVFALFSGYSLAGAERFMLTRTRQGKEALGNIIIPAALLMIADIISDDEERPVRSVIPLWILGVAGSLTSFFSNLLVGVLTGLLAVYVLITKRDVKRTLICLSAVIPEIVMILVYAIL